MDGYNRGFQIGLGIKKRETKSKAQNIFRTHQYQTSDSKFVQGVNNPSRFLYESP
jgi:hypothetical protein